MLTGTRARLAIGIGFAMLGCRERPAPSAATSVHSAAAQSAAADSAALESNTTEPGAALANMPTLLTTAPAGKAQLAQEEQPLAAPVQSAVLSPSGSTATPAADGNSPGANSAPNVSNALVPLPRKSNREVTHADAARIVNLATPEPPIGSPMPTPKLKPILGEPFPGNVSQEVVCEAINSKEPDMWVRFGHLFPFFMPGAIYILQAGKDKEAGIDHFIGFEYVHPQYPQQASCGDKTLLYLSNMMDGPTFRGKPQGRAHLAATFEITLGLKVLEFFGFERQDERFAAYCRVDADACEGMLKLNVRNEGEGMCPTALSAAGVDADEEKYEALCRKLPASVKVCAFAYTGQDKQLQQQFQACKCTLRDALGLPQSYNCLTFTP